MGYKKRVSKNGLSKPGCENSKKGFDLCKGTFALGRRSEGLMINCYQMTIPDDYAVLL
ncbi:hypothetical protein PHOSAC3_150396 [Mesotoga infera]|nr:hypothetical protein PHOSAC3_150396 [Mesotoga infera]